MKGNYTLTTELKRIFTHIKQELVKEYPTNKILIEYFLISILRDESSVAYQIIEKVTLSETIDVLHQTLERYLTTININQISNNVLPLFDVVYDEYLQNITKNNQKVDSGLMLIEILKNNNEINKTFRGIGVSCEQIEKSYNEQFSNTEIVQEEKTPKPKKEKKKDNNSLKLIKPLNNSHTPNNDVERYLTNLSRLSEMEQIDNVIGLSKIYNKIFRIFGKKQKNNVVIVGDSGVGKTCIVENIANLIKENQVPKTLQNKILMKLCFNDLLMGSGIRGMLETKFKSIINDAKKDGKYIIFIDDIHTLLEDQNKNGETDIVTLLDGFLSEPNIMFICTTNHKSYNKNISKHSLLKRRLCKVEVEEPKQEDIENIVNYKLKSIEQFHNVKFDDDSIKCAINLSQRYLTDSSTIDNILDVLDETASFVNSQRNENEYLIDLKKELNDIIEQKESINLNTTDVSHIEKYDILTKREITIKTKIHSIEKEEQLNKEILPISTIDIKQVISDKINIAVTDIAENEKDKLKNLNTVLKKTVIGQDKAIDSVCRVVKRQRVGISDPTKPPVLLFAGSTGTGKTFLSKQITKELFGDEKHLVRLDMSEYIDKTSTNKLIGAGSGYVGYENGGVLTEAIKKHKHCVLLLDEIEKANEDVHNVFLQLFDEGRLTDNTGEVVDFRHCIIIMTSNVGAKECDERGNGIGFNQNVDFSNEIINKSLKKVFKPEFINRINDIVYFNKLTDDDYKIIIKNEIEKIVERIKSLGFDVDETITTTDLPSLLFDRIQKMKQYGARPIVRELQKILEDSVTDYIIDNNPNNGFVFSFHNLKV